MENLTLSMMRDSRRIIIECVLNSDFSKHYSLITALKTKLGNDFPSQSLEDRILILSMCLRTSDIFKVVREGRNNFVKWMEHQFDEYYKQGATEHQLELQVSKFMDKTNTNKEKAYLNYMDIVCLPLLSTFMIIITDEEVKTAVFKDGIMKNKKILEGMIESNAGK